MKMENLQLKIPAQDQKIAMKLHFGRIFLVHFCHMDVSPCCFIPFPHASSTKLAKTVPERVVLQQVFVFEMLPNAFQLCTFKMECSNQKPNGPCNQLCQQLFVKKQIKDNNCSHLNACSQKNLEAFWIFCLYIAVLSMAFEFAKCCCTWHSTKNLQSKLCCLLPLCFTWSTLKFSVKTVLHAVFVKLCVHAFVSASLSFVQ